MELSISFWSALRTSGTGFFYILFHLYQRLTLPGLSPPPPLIGTETNLGLGPTLVEFLLLGLCRLFRSSKIRLIDLVQSTDAGQVYRGRSSDNVAGIYAAERNAVDLEGTGDQKDAVGERLEVHDALAAESPRKDDQDFAWDKGRTEGGWFLVLADLDVGVR